MRRTTSRTTVPPSPGQPETIPLSPEQPETIPLPLGQPETNGAGADDMPVPRQATAAPASAARATPPALPAPPMAGGPPATSASGGPPATSASGGPPTTSAPPGPAAPPTSGGPAAADPAEQEREAAVALLFDQHYTSMLRLAALLGADDPENIVAEAYYQIYRKWRKLRDAGSAEAYLRSTVCNLTRMRIRHLQVARRHAEAPSADWVASAENSALLRDDQRVLVNALQQLPARQREALVLRHWLGLKESEIAAAMGISAGSVKTHTARGLAALTQALEARR